MEELTVGGMVLGLFPHAQYESTTVKLEPGDHLVLFTDGVLEARNKSGRNSATKESGSCCAKTHAPTPRSCSAA